MEHSKWDNTIGFFSGIFGGSMYVKFAGITWQSAWESMGHVLWLGFIALLSGAMGVLGKHLAQKYLKRKTKS